MQVRLWGPCAAMVAVLAMTIGGCGGSSSTPGSSSEAVPSTSAATEGGGASESSGHQVAEKWFKGTYELPHLKPFTVAKDKTLWIITFGQLSVSAQRYSGAMSEAARQFGWKVKIYDGKFEPNEYLAGVRSAIGAHADAISTFAIDCSTIAPGLKEAADAGIPVVNAEGSDCDEGGESGEHLFTYNLTWSGQNLRQYFLAFGETQAAWLAAEQSDAKVLNFAETDARVTLAVSEGFEAGLEKLCPECEILETTDFVGTEIGPPLQQKAEQALLRHPDATAVMGNYEDPIINSVAPAIQNAGRTGTTVVVGGEPGVSSMELIHEGKLAAAAGIENFWEGYAAFDAAARCSPIATRTRTRPTASASS